jgi:hypothetical protein
LRSQKPLRGCSSSIVAACVRKLLDMLVCRAREGEVEGGRSGVGSWTQHL